MKKLLSLALVAFVVVLAGCREKTPGEKIDAAAKDVKEAAGDAAKAASDAVKK